MNCKESITVNRQSIDWLKKNYPDLCIKAGLCERVAGKLYTKILSVNLAAAPEAPKPAPGGLETRMYQDAEGKRPVTGVNQPVGLVRQSWAPKRKPLTDEQIDAIMPNPSDFGMYQPPWSGSDITILRAMARAVEAAHEIKENSND